MPEAMSSTYAYHSQLLENNSNRMQESHNGGLTHIQQPSSAAAADSNHLSPLSTPNPRSNSASPTVNHTHTPGSTLSVNYQSSDFSEYEEVDPFDTFVGDPFVGIDFGNADGGTPSFLDQSSDQLPATFANGQPYHPLSPEQTPSLHTSSPQVAVSGLGIAPPAEPALEPFPTVDVVGPPKLIPGPFDNQSVPHQLTPDTHSSGQSSEDGLTATAPAMPCQSPRVTVSMWGKDHSSTVQSMSNAFIDAEPPSPATVRGPGFSQDDSVVHSASSGIPTARDEQGSWLPNASTGQGGLDPSSRPSGEVTSANELAARRKIDERNQEVDEWLSGSSQSQEDPGFSTKRTDTMLEGVSDKEISLGDDTENMAKDGRTYYNENGGGPMTKEDQDIINQDRNWGDAPVLHQISTDRHQPQTSNAAIQKFERLCQDNDSIVSRAATWGTRRRSFPSLLEIDIENITSGNFLKKLSISRGETGRRPSLLKELRGLVRKPSATQLLKRTRSVNDEEAPSTPDSDERRDSKNTLAPPTRAMSWGKKQPVPSINTALVSMGSSVAAIGTTHARSGSISTTPPVTSPKSPFSLKVGNTLRRQRSKSDIPNAKSLADNSHPTLVGMWKKTGGPPVATLVKTTSLMDADDDDDDDDEFEDADMKVESIKMLQDITPNFSGFQQHVLRLNPLLASENNYLVDRIAHQQCIRYKSLLNSRVKHINYVQNRNCPCGPMCIALGGSANILDGRGDTRGMDPVSARFEHSDGDTTPLEGAIAQESFPQDIPMPPTQTLPAEFECQLCYQAKKFQKPSDWTKHVHEDVQPFTCTWDRCRDPKIFKRKADWVRHENEGHRHLEWWTCDVEDCRHTCYRRDNFLQHLVREHKFNEPKVKTKAAIKKAGGADPTWQKVERCHAETQARPQDEPCRFCGKSFPTWKKLTVHLAKHMEQISLPVLKLVAQKELEADTIISPVQDPPPRSFAPLPVKREPGNMGISPNMAQPQPMGMLYGAHALEHPLQHPQALQSAFVYPMPSQQPHNAFYPQSATYDRMGAPMQSIDTRTMDVSGYETQYHPPPMSATSATYMTAPDPYGIPVTSMSMAQAPLLMNPLGLQSQNGQASMGYDNMMDPVSAGPEHYTPQGSTSPYGHSPHQPQGPPQYYSQ